MKKAFFAVLLLFCPILCACTKAEYQSVFSADELCRKCADVLEIEDAAFEQGESFSGEELPIQNPEIAVCFSGNANNLDEIGIWKTTGGTAKKAATFLGDSLFKRYRDNLSFYDSYIPEQTPKLRDAEVRVYGKYAVYAILAPEQKKLFFQTLEELLATKEEQGQTPVLFQFCNSFSIAAIRTQTVKTCMATRNSSSFGKVGAMRMFWSFGSLEYG